MLDNAIEVDDPCFDLGEETTVLEEALPQRQTLTITEVPEWSTTTTSFESGQTEQPVVGSTQTTPMRNTTKFIGVIGKTRSKMFPVSENKLDYFDRDDEDDDESNNNDEEPKELSESSKEDRSAILNDSGDKLKRTITDNTDGDYIPNLQIDIMVKEMKNSIQFFNLAFLGIMGSDLIEWITFWKNWPRPKSIQLASYLLKTKLIKAISPNLKKKPFSDNIVYKFSFNLATDFYQIPGPSPDVVIINIGGQIFHTNEKTLTSIPNTYFTTLLSQPPQNGIYFIDRNPSIFEDILDYLRDGEIYLPPEKKLLEKLKREAQFFKLVQLEEMCNKILS